HYKTLNISIEANKSEYQKREKVNLDLAIDEAEGDFSIAVTDARSVQAQEQDILTYSLLTSELKGRIENPSYYFEKTEASEKALDNLLLTQGWRRFTWKQTLQDEKPSFAYQIEHGIGMSGTAKDEFGKMVKNKSISLFNVKNNFLATSSVDKNGYFEILDMDIQDSLEVMVRVEKEKNVRLKINEPISPILTSPVPFLDYPKVNTNFLTNSKQASKAEEEFRAESDVRVLKEVTVKDTKIETEYVPTVWKLHGEADFVIDGKKLEKNAMSYQHIVWGLQGQAPGLTVNAPQQIGEPPILSLGRGSSHSPLFLLDGVIVGINFLSGINPSDIDYVEVLIGANAAIYGSSAANGVVAFYTKMGSDKDNSQYVAKKTIQGYYTAQEFYSPNYENPTETEKLKPDFRTTLHWNPSVKIDTKGKASLSFFCADVPTKYRIVVEGRSKNGTLGRKEIFVEVKK
nr:TonB-dependent receptor plug domain-containing protein [Thermoflexibacter sp.]